MTWELVALIAVCGLLAYLFRQALLICAVAIFSLCIIGFAAASEKIGGGRG
jgi:hypothetical protein